MFSHLPMIGRPRPTKVERFSGADGDPPDTGFWTTDRVTSFPLGMDWHRLDIRNNVSGGRLQFWKDSNTPGETWWAGWDAIAIPLISGDFVMTVEVDMSEVTDTDDREFGIQVTDPGDSNNYAGVKTQLNSGNHPEYIAYQDGVGYTHWHHAPGFPWDQYMYFQLARVGDRVYRYWRDELFQWDMIDHWFDPPVGDPILAGHPIGTMDLEFKLGFYSRTDEENKISADNFTIYTGDLVWS